MVYVPDLNYACYTIYDKDTIRAYHSIPEKDTETTYTDFFIHSDYYTKQGTEIISKTMPVCLEQSNLTDSVYYRVDLVDILVIFLIFCIFAFLIPIKVFLRLFRRFQ